MLTSISSSLLLTADIVVDDSDLTFTTASLLVMLLNVGSGGDSLTEWRNSLCQL